MYGGFMKKLSVKLNQTQWFILLWLAGFLALGVIAGLFKVILIYAAPYLK
ncbi:hypothetical protein F935_01632 [Acinetobacter calcoaceticus ANC 3811]|jgi:hypothetical protein|uniref:DUF2474 domain-containing protein n=2 Tax=Acinetobacter calcoaceticus/baumannii complex TaxID=909768 RepID=R8Y956_ACICA|nr:hypothetical protein F935_01632 [Acinetobacter calcoaceticus ANC 3811]